MALELILEDGRVLDILEEVGMGLNYSSENLTKPETRTTNYSKTIVLAGTKNNNKILGQIYDISSDFTVFNPNFRLYCKLYYDGVILMDGYLQLRNVNVENLDNITYEVVINSSVIDLWQDIGENELSDLNFSDLDHTINYSTIYDSWFEDYTNKYVYPVLYKNNFLYEANDFKPALYLRTYIDRIADTYGFSFGGSLFDDELFNKEIIPYSGKDPEINEEEANSREYLASQSATTSLVQFRLFKGNDFTISSWNRNILLGGDTWDTDEDPNDVFDTTVGEWTVNKDGLYQLNANIGLELEAKTFGVNGYLDYDLSSLKGLDDYTDITTYAYIEKKEAGSNEWKRIFGGQNDLNAPPSDQIIVGQPVGEFAGLPGNPLVLQGSPLAWSVLPGFSSGNDWTRKVEYNYSGTFFNRLLLKTGDKIRTRIFYRFNRYFRYTNQGFDQNVGVHYYWRTKSNLYNPASGNFDGVPTQLFNKTVRDYITENTDIKMNDYIPLGIPQKSLLKDLITRYNLIVRPSPNNPRHILMDTRDKYYLEGEDLGVLDLSEYDDKNYNNKIEFLSDLTAKKFVFKYKDGDDEFSKNYLKTTKVGYGQKDVIFNNEFVKGEKVIESIFQSTPIIFNGTDKTMAVPNIPTVDPEGTPTVLIWNGLRSCFDTKRWRYRQSDELTRFLPSYPFAGHWDHNVNATLDNHFNSIITLNNGEQDVFEYYNKLLKWNNNNLFNRYWRNYISTVNTSKLVTKKIFLTPQTVDALKDNLNKKIFIDGEYFIVNTIQDYDPTKAGESTVVKLLKSEIEFIDFQPEETIGVVLPNVPDRGGIRGFVPVKTMNNGKALQTVNQTTDNQTESQHVGLIGFENKVDDVSKVSVTGRYNKINSGVENSGVLGGDNNEIAAGVKNSWVIGANDKYIDQDNTVWVTDMKIGGGAVIQTPDVITGDLQSGANLFAIESPRWDLVDGGQNVLRDADFINPINLISGGDDRVFIVDE